MLGRVLNHLEALVGCDTQNPPRTIDAEHRVFSYCAQVLRGCGCRVEIDDLGDGCVNLLATRGQTETILNCHLDTVPTSEAWTRDPFALEVESGRAYGLGACDIKGAAACMLSAAQESDGAMALLLTSDEEAGQSRCVRSFVERNTRYSQAIVAEPTHGKAVLAHRGVATFEIEFMGKAGHSSLGNGQTSNALHHASRWCARAIEWAPDDLRFNIGVIQGGTKPNVSASSARVVFGMRPQAGQRVDELVDALHGLIEPACSYHWRDRFRAPALAPEQASRAMVESYGFDEGEPVDFWTEAALFARAGLATLVLGPGDIKQAHSADEFVELDELEPVCRVYQRVFGGSLVGGHMNGVCKS